MPTIDLGYRARPQFVPLHKRKQRWVCVVAHRRAGKTVACVADLVDAALRTPRDDARFAYVAPFYAQAKDIAWEYLKGMVRPIPGVGINESELRVDLPHGPRIRLYGADNHDRMRGIYLDGVVLDEHADFPANAWPAVIRPALSDRKGWATFIGTPKGKNEFYQVYRDGLNDPEWLTLCLRASETGLIAPDELDAARRAMGRDRYDQEFECSFEAALVGSYWGAEMRKAAEEGRIGKVPHERGIQVVTAWDLGVGDSTAIWFAQFVGRERRIIDYYEASGAGLDHYVKVLQGRGYLYGRHILPHDARVRELGTGKSRIETLASLGVHNVDICPDLFLDDGIQAVRMSLDATWFDAERCERGIEALKGYRASWDEKGKTWRGRPEHDWTSHAADAFRYLTLGYKPMTGTWGKPLRRNLKGIA